MCCCTTTVVPLHSHRFLCRTMAYMDLIDPELLKHATAEEKAHYEQFLRLQLELQSPADYAAARDPEFLRPPHVELLNSILVKLTAGTLLKADGTPYRKLLVTEPPRHGKSEFISKWAPAWFLKRFPRKKVGVCGYEAEFAASWGRKVRDILEEDPTAPKIRSDNRAAHRWELEAGGGMFTAGVGGPLTGKGFQWLDIDDPIKNFEDASSETMRDKAWDWVRSTALTRLEPGGFTTLVMTRWHADDIAGRFLAEEADDWYHLDLPAIAGEADPLGRKVGEALWPERYSIHDLEKLRKTVGPQIWASLYQQKPYVEGGGLFRTDRVRLYTSHEVHNQDTGAVESRFLKLRRPDGPPEALPETRMATFGVIDLAASTRTTADFSVFALFGVSFSPEDGEDDRKLILLRSFRARIEGADHMNTLERLHKEWQPRFWGIERATYGLSLVQTATRTGKIPIRELKPAWDKVSRAYAAGALLEAGRLYFPKDEPFTDEWLSEMVQFPNGRHDDMVDTLSYAAHIFNERLHAPRPVKSKDTQTTEERIWAQIKRKKTAGKNHPILGAGF